MAVGRTPPPPVPSGTAPNPERAWRMLIELWKWAINNHEGLPAPHGQTHTATGTDPLPKPGIPVPVSLTSTSAGVGPSYAYEDHQHNVDATVSGAIQDATLLAWIL